MPYVRKTVDTWFIMYKYPGQPKEEIDETTDRKNADFLLKEYRLAYRGQAGHVWKVKKRVPIQPATA